MAHRFRILNVFAEPGARLSGNPLCVFESGAGLDDATMLALARQFNLSETTFILPAESEDAHARVRIFTPTFEMPFAGHPTLGTAHVVSALRGVGERVTLEMKAGLIEVTRSADRWTLRTAGGLVTREPEASVGDLALSLGLDPSAIAGPPLWVDTGAEQLVIPLASPEDVRRARPRAELLQRHAFSAKRGACMAYVWARLDDGDVLARFFFLSDGAVIEDPATGSACANLGGWMMATGVGLPVSVRVRQGEAIRRPSVLHLAVERDSRIFVGGAVIELGSGELRL
jgi:trans-2,3-dihydro-3-hydroxyanthranilate isomerase